VTVGRVGSGLREQLEHQEAGCDPDHQWSERGTVHDEHPDEQRGYRFSQSDGRRGGETGDQGAGHLQTGDEGHGGHPHGGAREHQREELAAAVPRGQAERARQQLEQTGPPSDVARPHSSGGFRGQRGGHDVILAGRRHLRLAAEHSPAA
jgi:hypothetical protein